MNRSKQTKLFVGLVVVIALVIGSAPIWQHYDEVISKVSGVFSGGFGIITKPSVNETLRVVSEESATIDVVKKVKDSVVSVVETSIAFDVFNGLTQQEASIGTGFYVGDTIIITNKHVVSDTQSTYSVVDATGERHAVTSIFRDPINDLSVLTVENLSLAPLEMGDSSSLQVGQTVIAIGNALGGFSNTVTKGVVSGVGRGIVTSGGLGQFQEELDGVIQTDAALNPGNSGGPLLNLDGQVIGVNVAMSVGSENIGFAIPSNTLTQLITDFKSGTVRQRPLLGVSYAIITPDFARNSEFPEGALVRQVVSGSAADEAGLKVNDVITQIDGQAISEDTSLSSIILRHKVGDSVSLTVYRNGSYTTIDAVLKASAE